MAHGSTSPTILGKYHDATRNDKKGVRLVARFCNVAARMENRDGSRKQTVKAISKGQRQPFVQQVNLSLLSMIIKLLIYSLVNRTR